MSLPFAEFEIHGTKNIHEIKCMRDKAKSQCTNSVSALSICLLIICLITFDSLGICKQNFSFLGDLGPGFIIHCNWASSGRYININ